MILALTAAAVLGVTNLQGQAVSPFAATPDAVRRALVFVFIEPDCPVSNRYVPELNRLYDLHRRADARMWVVYSGALDPALVRAHYAAYQLRVPALLDPQMSLADAAGVAMTPEAAVFDVRSAGPHGEPTLVYRGRIDDRAVRAGVWRPVPTTRDLGAVLDRIRRGERVPYRTTQAVGCFLRPSS